MNSIHTDRPGLHVQSRSTANPTLAPWLRSGSLVAADVMAFAAAVTLSFALGNFSAPLHRVVSQLVETGPFWHGWGTLLVFACLLAFFGGRGQYTGRVPFWSEFGVALSGSAIALLCDTFIKAAVFGRAYGYEGAMRWVFFVPLLLAFRQLARSLLDACGLWSLRTVIVGDKVTLTCARDALQSEPRLGYRIVGTLDVTSMPEDEGIRPVLNLMKAQDAGFVVVAAGHENGPKEHALVSALARAKITFALVPTFEGLPVLGFRQHYFFSYDIMLLVCRNNLARPLSRLVKYVFDQVVAAGLLLVLSPLFLAVTAMVRMDGGPALFGHGRIGANGERFKCFKFRSMVTNADEVLGQLLRENPDARREWADTQKLRDDPRVTRIGRFLRKTSLDELPQLINVVTGHMSLVGPRPIVEAEIPRYGRDIEYYYETRPGMTGLWQVSGRSDASYERRVQLDVWYVRNWTLWHDIMILLKTVPAVLRKDGAV